MKTLTTIALLITATNLFCQTNIIFKNSEPKSDTVPSMTLSGAVDAYYLFNTNTPGLRGSWGTSGIGRLIDGEHNQIAFNMLQTMLTYKNKNLTIVGDLLFGPGAEALNYGNNGTSRLIKQAYVEYTLKKATFTVGQFGTFIGYEMPETSKNDNYSLSYLFTYGPYYHTGAKVDYEISDKVTAMFGVLNGWDSMKDNNQFKTYAAQVNLAPSDQVEVYINWIGGNEESDTITGDSVNSFKQMFDVSLNADLTNKISAGLNTTYGHYSFANTKSRNWGGLSVYLSYVLNSKNKIATRAEYFDDSNGVQGFGAAYLGYTLTYIKSMVNDQLLIKPEIRYDESNRNLYFKNNNALTNSQFTIGLAIVANF